MSVNDGGVTPMPQVRLGDVVRVVDQEYRYQGAIRHRQRRVTDYTACCLTCGWNLVSPWLSRVRREGREHRCDPKDVREGPTAFLAEQEAE